MVKKLAASLALAAMALSAPTQAQNRPDFTEDEITAMALYAMPLAFSSLQRKCASVLDPQAYIYAYGDELSERLRISANGQFPYARAALMKFAGDREDPMLTMVQNLPPETLEPLVSEMVTAKVFSEIKTSDCGEYDRVLALLDPLPPENLAQLAGFLAVKANREASTQGALGL
ncbi:hypothetical protein [Alteraurantiacibacter aquimixticola]|uniref:DUF2059 domain-containing protein n=1 Tax=Alteraurantiacibacter aquimixticola TaxID=2489173 RepID=A0A4T3F1X2_9SPHN|nr:hypothetical protein [Alteraurantiacibacter aquimixticola]TIX50040.1 hypothetical protein E5222_06990 [Alteraurantiacibacter aquimixticola]